MTTGIDVDALVAIDTHVHIEIGHDGHASLPGALADAASKYFKTDGARLYEVTDHVDEWLAGTGIGRGILTLLCQHTSAGLLITENASGAVRRDVLDWLDRIAPEGRHYAHDDEGPDDMPAHLKAVLTNPNLSLPVSGGRPMLGTWQGIFLAEHRRMPHRRAIALHLLGE